VEAALLAYELPTTTNPTNQPLPSERAWLALTHEQRLAAAQQALGWPYTHSSPVVAATELGVSLELFARLRLKKDDKPTPPPKNPHREKRIKRVKPDQYQGICDRLDKAGSIQCLAVQIGQPYWYVHRLAKKAGWSGIRFQDNEPVAEKIQRLFNWLDEHLDAKPMVLNEWMAVIQGSARDVFTEADRRVCRKVLLGSGLVRRMVDGRVLWGKNHWFRA
jgi:hypothetical protein